jgi:hypothetical protein
MPRRRLASNIPQLLPLSPPTPDFHEPLSKLRTQWKWAAFSQFFFTFNHLFAMNEVSLNVCHRFTYTTFTNFILTFPTQDIEDDLVRGSSIVLPRIMQRLLYILSYDRKVS